MGTREKLSLELEKMHRDVPAALDKKYERMHQLLRNARFPNPWLISATEAHNFLEGKALREYEELETEIEALKDAVRQKVTEVFMNLKDELEWKRERPWGEGTMGDRYQRDYRANIASGYALSLFWNNILMDATNSIDLRIKGLQKEWFPDFGPVVAGPPEEGPFSFEEEARKVPQDVREAIFALFISLRERLG